MTTMGNTLACSLGLPPQDPLNTGPQHHSDFQWCTHSLKMICKLSTSYECRLENRLCTSIFPSENSYNHTNRPSLPRSRRKAVTISRPPTNGDGNYEGGGGWGHPECLLINLWPRIPEIIPCCPNQRYRWDRPTGRRRRRPRSPNTHQDCRP